jgi:hypothetical protein
MIEPHGAATCDIGHLLGLGSFDNPKGFFVSK